MPEENESDFEEWIQDVEFLVHTLKESFESTDARYNIDEMNDILYVELEGLDEYSENEIIEIAEPILEVSELNFEDIVLLPLKN
ncbi:hypothetical protein [Rhodohalobacter sp. 614A]|uniref:hypothetical protein n=1 Tax=Rhodohalobacter sp. 614A TaxID=2908649 RepID=UPI001F1B753B|nr:hypothetical protein [Rhodohalobacter sp. 614A]